MRLDRILAGVTVTVISRAPATANAQSSPLSSILPEPLSNTMLLPPDLPDQPNHVVIHAASSASIDRAMLSGSV